MNTSVLRTTVVALFLGLAGAAHAAVSSVVPDSSGNFTIIDTTGPAAPETFTLVVSPTTNPIPVVFYDTNPPFSQSPSVIAAELQTLYGTPPLGLVTQCDNIPGGCTGTSFSSSTFSLTGLPAFDFLALHFGGGELFFHWASPITGVTLTASPSFPGGLSDYRTYLTTPLPGALLLFLTALGFFGLRRGIGIVRGTPA